MPLGKSVETEGLEKTRLYSAAVHAGLLTIRAESVALGAAPLVYFPVQRGKCPGPTHSTPQAGTKSCQRLDLVVQRQTRISGV